MKLVFLLEAPMNAIRKAGLLLGAALMAGCIERNAPTALRNQPGVAFDAAGLTSVVNDSPGDVKNGVPGWQDIVRTDVSKKDRTFVLTMDLAEIVPANPPVPSGGTTASHFWIWGFDTDPAAFPEGKGGVFPSGPGSAGNPSEFFLDVEWDGTQFTGKVYDLRPLLKGEPMVVTPGQPFTIVGARITLSVAASALGDPSTFGWGTATCTRHSDKFGTEAFQCFDNAPDAGFTTWPQ